MIDPKDVPTAECSACGDALAVNQKEIIDVVFSTDTQEKQERTRILIQVIPCECHVIEGQEKYVKLTFGELDEFPEEKEVIPASSAD